MFKLQIDGSASLLQNVQISKESAIAWRSQIDYVNIITKLHQKCTIFVHQILVNVLDVTDRLCQHHHKTTSKLYCICAPNLSKCQQLGPSVLPRTTNIWIKV